MLRAEKEGRKQRCVKVLHYVGSFPSCMLVLFKVSISHYIVLYT